MSRTSFRMSAGAASWAVPPKQKPRPPVKARDSLRKPMARLRGEFRRAGSVACFLNRLDRLQVPSGPGSAALPSGVASVSLLSGAC